MSKTTIVQAPRVSTSIGVSDTYRKISLDVASLQSVYSTRELSPLDVVHFIYKQIASYHDKAVWIHLISIADALDYASSLVQRFKGKPLPPLYGVPFSVKDSIDVAGIPTTVACRSFAYNPTRTAPVVQKILDAGGILIGKTNLDQFATGLVGHRSPYGTPRCVFDSDYISGGSSSGSAVSVAACLVSFTVATDTAGSTRVPATLNGLVGLKPTLGTLSTVGLVPACKTADCITVITRTFADVRAAWEVMKGYDDEDVYARSSLPSCLPWPSAIRFGVPPDNLLALLSTDYARLFSLVVELLSSSLGCVRTPFDYGAFQSANNMLYGTSIVAQRLVAFDSYLQIHGPDDLHPVIREIFSSSSGFDAVRAYQDIFDLASYKRRAEIQFRDIDILVVPSTIKHFTVAEIDEDPIGRNKLMGTFTHFVNLLDLCAVSVPAGMWKNARGNEMPFGVTLIGQAGRDKDLMELGSRLMKVAGEDPRCHP